MKAALVAIVLLGTVSASWQSPFHHWSIPVPLKVTWPDQQEPKCCAPSAYTYGIYGIQVGVEDGQFITNTASGRGAYDAKGERESIEFLDDVSNGTEYQMKIISDYKEGMSYFIQTDKGKTVCHTVKLEGDFQEYCVPDESIFTGVFTIGNRALPLANWYYNLTIQDEVEEHVSISVEEPKCVFVNIMSRQFDPESGTEEGTTYTSFSDFNLGITDPDKWFKPPPECKTPMMSKKVLGQHFRGPHGLMKKKMMVL